MMMMMLMALQQLCRWPMTTNCSSVESPRLVVELSAVAQLLELMTWPNLDQPSTS
jgi:hypothetical protein